MRASREEFIAIMRRFPNYAHTPASTVEVLYQDYLDAHTRFAAELMDYFKYRFFDISDSERGEYLTRRQYAELCSRVNDAALVERLQDKAAFYERFDGYLGRCWVVARQEGRARFADLCARSSHVVVKSRTGGYGRGVEIASTAHPELLWMGCVEQEALVEEFIVQHPVLGKLHPSSVNCVRAVTALDPSGSATLIAAAVRCGRDGASTDSGNGLFASIDLAAGRVASEGVTHFSERFERHPDTAVAFKGFEIPAFAELCAAVRAIAESEPGLRLMNWDLACREDGHWCLIEGNFAGGLGPCQEAGGTGLARDICTALDIPFGGGNA